MIELKEARKQQGLSLTELAYKSGVSVATISRIENGVSIPRRRNLAQIQKALGLLPEDVAMPLEDPQSLIERNRKKKEQLEHEYQKAYRNLSLIRARIAVVEAETEILEAHMDEQVEV